ncbi:MAG: hypothetical protein EOO05_17115 [Chitinophagaceae bacterium]|nr:MAG: hypothetical protein EOO05_17115 [Chitinophagaceae bacterium]
MKLTKLAFLPLVALASLQFACQKDQGLLEKIEQPAKDSIPATPPDTTPVTPPPVTPPAEIIETRIYNIELRSMHCLVLLSRHSVLT